MDKKIRVMFVCMGNICRSPLAEGVFRHLAREAGSGDAFEIASSGTGGWHVGDPPDRRMRQTATRHGISLDGQRARQFERADFERYDHILAMDEDNLRHLEALSRHDAHRDKLALFRSHDPEPGDGNVPDPYYGGDSGFEEVYRIVHRTAGALLQSLRD
ncbi:MAG: low molecular weight protein-tyrosine-phosphatase [Rhodothermales bacterium]